MTDVIMPQMGESIAEGTITKWMKKVGDRVQRDEPLFEISTDKVDAEIPAPASGVLREIRVEAGTTVPINTVVAVIGEGDTAAATPPPAAAQATPAPPPRAPQAESPSTAGAGATPTSPPPSPAPAPAPPSYAAPAPSAPPARPPSPAPPVSPTVPATTWSQAPPGPASAPPPGPAPGPTPEKPRAEMTADELRQTRSSPVVRKIAAEHNVDISRVPGTGISGRVTKQDILGHIEGRPGSAPASGPSAGASTPGPAGARGPTPAPGGAPAPSSAPAPPPPQAPPAGAPSPPPAAAASSAPRPGPMPTPTGPVAAPATPAAASTRPAPGVPGPAPPGGGPTPFVPAYHPGERVEIVPMSPIRKKTAEHMVTSKRISAHVTTVAEIDMSRVAQLRGKYRQQYEERSGVKLTYMPFIVKATIDALKAFPILNASVDGENIVYKKDLNIGMAVALDWGLIVPVIRNADEKNVLGLARAIGDLAERARARKLKIEEVQGGTFTITNPGVFGSLFGTPIINQPQVGILGVGTIEKRPVVRDDAIAIRTMAYFALSFDHRIVDGSDADRFLAHLKKGLQEFDESAL
jgi:pyruvate dehydrogenase E2 component (dihydrolipoamide acetyltransferase)